MMTPDLPEHLRETRDLLMRSLPAHPLELAPPAPGALVSDLSARFLTKESRPAAATPSTSWLVSLRSFLSAPAFGAVAAAVLLLGVALPMAFSPADSGSETFRGAAKPEMTSSARILLVGDLPAVRSAITGSGYFETSVLSTSNSLVDALNEAGPRIIVDASEGLIRAFGSDGSEIHAVAIPSDPEDIPALIARLISRL